MQGAEFMAALLSRAADEQIPVSGSIALTHRCQLHCVHCYLGEERFQRPEGELSTGFWTGLLKDMAAEGCLNLLITGGEPLLRRDFEQIYSSSCGLGMLVTVFTNATLVNERIAALLSDLPPQLVEVSLYGATAETYERVTKIPGSFARCLAGIDALMKHGVAVSLKTVILAENVHEVAEMGRMAAERGLDFRVDPAIFPCLDGNPEPMSHRVDVDRAVALEMLDPARVSHTALAYERTATARPSDALFSCLAGLTGFHVDPRGMLFPCMMVHGGGFDLTQGTFRQGWRGAMPGFRRQEARPDSECRSCDLRLICGACPAQSALETGSLHRPSRFMCELAEARLPYAVSGSGPAKEKP